MKKKIISVIVAAAITVGLAFSALMFAFAAKEPIESWDLYTEFSTNLETLANSGVNYVDTPIANLNLGAFGLEVGYYSNVKNLSATAIGGKIPGGGNCHNVLELSGGNVGIHTCYTNAVNIIWTAPKTGKYTVDFSDTLAFSGAPLSTSSFKVLLNDVPLAIGENGETELKANGNLKDIDLDLEEYDILKVVVLTGINSSNSAQVRAMFNITVNLMEDLSPPPPIASYNIADEMRKNLGALDYNGVGNGYNYEVINETMLDYNFGPFNLVSIKGATKMGEVEKNSIDYMIHPNLKNSGKEGYEKDYYANPTVYVSQGDGRYDGIGLWAKHYATDFEYVFTAPSEGVYRIKNKSAYEGVPDSVYNAYPRDISFSVYVNGVAQNIGSGADKTVITLKNKEYSDIGGMDEIKLAKGDTIKFRFVTTAVYNNDGSMNWSAGNIYINFTVDAVELGNNLETAHTTFNVGDEMREKFANDTELDPVIENNKFGPYTLSFVYRAGEVAKFADANAVKNGNFWSAKTTVFPNPRIVTGLTDSLYPGIGLQKQDYSNHTLTIKFTAPTDGTYRFVPKDCYQGKSGSIYNDYVSDANITVKINDVQKGETITVPAKATGNFQRIDNIKLNKGDTITVTVKTEDPKSTTAWSWFTTYVNYDIDLVETSDDNFYYAGIALSDNIAKVGNETYVELGLTNLMENVSGFSAKVKFDKNLFEFVRAENICVTTDDFQVVDNGAGEIGVVYVSGDNDIGNNNVVRLYFKVKDSVNASTYTMTPIEAQYVRINKKDKSKVEVVNFKNFVADDASIKVR